MKYTIGEMSQLLGVTPHMLRYYEKVGIIRPETNNATGYRYYSVVDTRRFNLSRALFSSGISLERCSEILQGMPQPELEALPDEKIAEQKRQIQRTQIAIQYMESVKETYRSLDSQVGQVRIQYFPRFWRLNLSQNETPPSRTRPWRRKRTPGWSICPPSTGSAASPTTPSASSPRGPSTTSTA